MPTIFPPPPIVITPKPRLVIYHVRHQGHTWDEFENHCQVCLNDEGEVFYANTAPKLPRHPNCRCFYTDAPPGTRL